LVARVRQETGGGRSFRKTLEQHGGRRDRQVCLRDQLLFFRQRLGPVSLEAGVLVQAVVDDLPAELFPQRERERSPERRLNHDRDLVKLVLIARLRDTGENCPESVSFEPPIGWILTANSGERQQRDVRGDLGLFRWLSGSHERPVEDSLAAARESLRELLRPLPAIGPGDDRKKEDIRASRRALLGVEVEMRDLDVRLANSQQPLRRESPPDRATPVKRKKLASERVEPAAPALLPFRSHAAPLRRWRSSASREAIRRPTI